MNYYRITDPADVRDLGEQMTAWLAANNPKANDWAEQPPQPSPDATWVNGEWVVTASDPEPRWVDFSSAIMADPAINTMLGAVLQAAPGLYGGLVVGLQQASEGDSRVFINSWTAAKAIGLISAALVESVQALGAEYDLPSEFITALGDPEPVRVRARNPDGTFIADDPATPVDEAWVPAP